MQSPKRQEYYHQDKERKQEDESPRTTIVEQEEEQIGDIIDSTTLLAVKNKKRVHYPQINGEQPALDTEKTDSLQQNYDKTSSGIRNNKKKQTYHLNKILFSRSVFQNK
jgi:hypothetical protein